VVQLAQEVVTEVAVVYDVFYYGTLFALVVIASYVLVRVCSFAYFRTKLEHARRVMREMRGEE
jgi:hypothetical protein